MALAFALALLATLLAEPTSTVQAAGFVVNSTADEPDVSPGDGICASTPSGACTLRAAVMEANALPGADTITLPANRYELTRIERAPPCKGSVEDAGAFGDLDILDHLTITRAGAASTVVTLCGGLLVDRLINVVRAEAAVTITGLTVTRGRAESGGGIGNSGSLSLRNVVISGNTATGAANSLANVAGSVELKNSILYRATDDNRGGTITSLGNTIGGGDSCGFTAQADRRNTEPGRANLADNGGFSQTHALQPAVLPSTRAPISSVLRRTSAVNLASQR